MRKMATLRRIDAVNPIPDADAIEVASVGGWRVVTKKGEFAPGDLAIYCEIDSWIPHELAPFLSKGTEPREYGGVKGERLRTVKLRGQVSQGLLLPLGIGVYDVNADLGEGSDVSERLNIQKWEAPIPAQLAGEVRGVFPGFIPKTDQERIQNLTAEFADWTERKRETPGNSLWTVARRNDLIGKIRSTGQNLAFQGELIGEGIQGNPYKIKGQEFYLFDIYDIGAGRYLLPLERQALAARLRVLCVPTVAAHANPYDTLGIADIAQMLKFAEGKSTLMNTTEREGLVFKGHEEAVSFKAISNKFLLKGGN